LVLGQVCTEVVLWNLHSTIPNLRSEIGTKAGTVAYAAENPKVNDQNENTLGEHRS